MAQRSKSSIRVSKRTRREVNSRKQEGDSHDDVIQRLLRKAEALDEIETDGGADEQRLALAELKLRQSQHRAEVLEQRVRSLQDQLEEIESLTEAADFDIPAAEPGDAELTPDS